MLLEVPGPCLGPWKPAGTSRDLPGAHGGPWGPPGQEARPLRAGVVLEVLGCLGGFWPGASRGPPGTSDPETSGDLDSIEARFYLRRAFALLETAVPLPRSFASWRAAPGAPGKRGALGALDHWRVNREEFQRTFFTVEALDKETLDKEPRVWKPVELQLRIGHGYRRRPHQVRNPPGSEASRAHSLTNAPTADVFKKGRGRR